MVKQTNPYLDMGAWYGDLVSGTFCFVLVAVS